MLSNTLIQIALFTGRAVAGNQNVPITEEEMAALQAAGLNRRGNQNVPITEEEMSALNAAGLNSRDSKIEARYTGKVMSCGKKVNGKDRVGGKGRWVPLDTFGNLAHEFCSAYVGTDIAKGHETSDTYGVKLTKGQDANLIFAIYNTEKEGSMVVDYTTCYNAMMEPAKSGMPAGVNPPVHDEFKRSSAGSTLRFAKRDGDTCYGKDNNDVEGGYYKVDGMGAFGSEIQMPT
ncbi:putative Ecp2 effector protein domain-containing protein [Seiridium cardinale]|uniref:Ecp2 effector protein domain-containing protein n=1 Tax=Seiridium cardinale TaxID=138064 RepID=A0ABR2Y9X4_9PEZI